LIARERIASARVPGGPELHLVQHDRDFIIMVARDELMSTRMSGSEVALGTMTCERLGTAAPHVLIGGYGMGFTLRAVLAKCGPAAQVTVAELVPEIIDWARGPMQAMTGDCLDDSRVELRIDDVGKLIDGGRGQYDAILLDVDNGPDGLTRLANDGLYNASGLRRARAALRPGGVLAVWSAATDAAFTRRLQATGFTVDEVRVRARTNGKGPAHTIWFSQVA
jgi:spermidine synthase